MSGATVNKDGLFFLDGLPLGVREDIHQLPFKLWFIYYIFVRLRNRKSLIPRGLVPNLAMISFQLGDIIVTGHNDLEYVGGGYFLLVSKERSTKLNRGLRISNFLRVGSKNQLIIRKGRVIGVK
jgi:hypothetical protein